MPHELHDSSRLCKHLILARVKLSVLNINYIQDMQLGTNVLGHFHLTRLLLPALEAASASGQKARVVNTSSSGAYLAKGIYYDAAKDGPGRHKRDPTDMYYVSKLVSPFHS